VDKGVKDEAKLLAFVKEVYAANQS
jgi:hypothetical protein